MIYFASRSLNFPTRPIRNEIIAATRKSPALITVLRCAINSTALAVAPVALSLWNLLPYSYFGEYPRSALPSAIAAATNNTTPKTVDARGTTVLASIIAEVIGSRDAGIGSGLNSLTELHLGQVTTPAETSLRVTNDSALQCGHL